MDQIYEVKSTFLRLMKWVPGVFYEPAGLDGECLDAVLVMHSDEDYLDAPTGEQLAKRGFRVLCANVMVKEGLFFSQVEKPENPESMPHSMMDGARIMTVYNYLTSYAVRTMDDYGYGEDSVWGVDWDSTYCCPVGNVKHIKAPCLFMGMTAGWEFWAAETIYEMSVSTVRSFPASLATPWQRCMIMWRSGCLRGGLTQSKTAEFYAPTEKRQSSARHHRVFPDGFAARCFIIKAFVPAL